MALDLAATLERISENRERLNALDDVLADAIKRVEYMLRDLRIGIPVDVAYPVDGEEHWLSFQKHNNDWRVMHAFTEDGKQAPLASAPRKIRADVFVPLEDGSTALEQLILEAADALVEYAREREPMVERAKALIAAIEALGFRAPDKQTA